MLTDRLVLSELQKELAMMKTPGMSDGLMNFATNSATTSLHIEDKVQGLIDERNSLLKTGTYNMDDPVIVKLNREISSTLLMTNNN